MSKFNQVPGFMHEFENHILELETVSKLIRASSEAAEEIRDPGADKVMNLLIAAELLLSDQIDQIYEDFKMAWREFVTPEIEEDYNIALPDEVLEELGWVEGDEVDIDVLEDGTLSITKSTSPE
jgi:hypothetical protein